MTAKRSELIPLVAVITTAALARGSQEVETNPVEAGSDSTGIGISGSGATTGVLPVLAEEYSRINCDVSFKFLAGAGLRVQEILAKQGLLAVR